MTLPRLLSTYRLQFHKGFTFDHAVAIVPYLHGLGITHVYASPYFKAVAGSTHGYDVIDHSRLNPEIGDDAAYQRFVDALKQHGMSQILDIVPNHVGVDTNDNTWWNDVLKNGRSSRYADFFDIDWDAGNQKVLLPVLGESIGEAVAGGKLKIVGESVTYFDRRFPLRSDSRSGNQNSTVPETLARQHYRLAHWTVAPDEINYRRFFDVTSLAAIRMERPEVFAAAHAFLFELIKDGAIAGVRTDHPDGLTDPKAYLVELQNAYKATVPGASAPLPVWVEKILSTGEALRPDWPVAGTSGYDFLAAVNNLLVDSNAVQAMSAIFEQFTGRSVPYAEIVYGRKWKILHTALASELTALTGRLKTIAERKLDSRDFTTRQLRIVLQSLIAAFPVYRSYISSAGVDQQDVETIATAAAVARDKHPHDLAVISFIVNAVLQRISGLEDLTLPFAQKFQQLTSPVTAKGVEDTTFYIFNRLTSLNEVGGDPGRFGAGIDELHAYFSDRQRHWPTALSCLSTHDTKRSEDVRARISVLSEVPDQWSSALAAFDLAAPGNVVSANDRYLLYQTLIGAWTGDNPADFSTRVQAYMLKAIREAKTHTSWTDPNTSYETAVQNLVADLVINEAGRGFRNAVQPLLKKVTEAGYLNSLSQTLIRLTAPGVPDTYQGSELWDFSLVDPDNRRPADYVHRTKVLKEMFNARLMDLMPTIDDGRVKLFVNRRVLKVRHDHPDLFTHGSYQPLKTGGKFANSIFAFARSHGDQTAIVVVGRLMTQVGQSPIGSSWGDTTIAVPKQGRFRSMLEDREIDCTGTIPAAELFANAPIALLIG